MCKWLSIKQSVVLLMMPPHCSNDHAPKRLIILHACANVFSLPPVPRSLHSRGDVAAEETLFSHLQSLSASGGVREENAVVDLLVCSDVVYPAGRQEATMYRELAETIARICTRPGNSAPSWAMIGFEDRDSGVSWMSFLDTEGLLADPQTVAECQVGCSLPPPMDFVMVPRSCARLDDFNPSSSWHTSTDVGGPTLAFVRPDSCHVVDPNLLRGHESELSAGAVPSTGRFL